MKLNDVTAGSVMIISGIMSLIHSISRISTFTLVGEPTPKLIYFYWSLIPLPISSISGGRIILTNMLRPAMTYEVLLPWLMIGLALVAAGVFILLRGRSATDHGDRQRQRTAGFD